MSNKTQMLKFNVAVKHRSRPKLDCFEIFLSNKNIPDGLSDFCNFLHNHMIRNIHLIAIIYGIIFVININK